MPKFVMLSTLGPDGSARLAENPERLREVSAEVEAQYEAGLRPRSLAEFIGLDRIRDNL